VEAGQLWALNHIPFYAEFHRARMIWVFGDRVWPAVVADPDWQQTDLSMNETNHGMREALIDFIKEGLSDKTAYVDKCIPDFPVWGKRLVVDNGWYPTLARDNVALITDPITSVTATGVETVDATSGEATHHEVDALILATGFHSNQFLWPIDIIGKHGQSLAEVWGDSANAYKGVSVPDFPNLYCLYGPNTNIVHGGSIIYQVECQIHYVMQCITAMLDKSVDSLEVRAEVNEAYNNEVQAISQTLAWGHPNVESWYKNSAGRVVNNSPYSLQRFWEITHDLELDDYHLSYTGDNEAA
jgi:4-hydroxyacetophenone monooxygenase